MTEQRKQAIWNACVEDYTHLRWLKNDKGEDVLCGLGRFIYTVGLVIGLDETGYFGRYCFEHHRDALEELLKLEKLPSNLKEMGGNWIKFKGYVEFANEKYEKNESRNYQKTV